MSKTSSIIHEACVRFDDLKAISVSRHAGKAAARAAAAEAGLPAGLAPSTGRIHSDGTLDTYKGLSLVYVQWCRRTQAVRHLADLDARADELVATYLTERMEAGASAHTLATMRSALRMFHRPGFPIAEREAAIARLGADVVIPHRRREEITRSRGHVAMDDAIDLSKHEDLVAFCRAVGPRRRELAALTVGAVGQDEGGLTVEIANGKGGKKRTVPVLPGHEDAVIAVIAGRDPRELIFKSVPVRIDVHSYRREYAQALYTEAGRRVLPSPHGRLDMATVDRERALYVSRALGHNRIDVVLRHYLR